VCDQEDVGATKEDLLFLSIELRNSRSTVTNSASKLQRRTNHLENKIVVVVVVLLLVLQSTIFQQA
jgi:hypothetical protein